MSNTPQSVLNKIRDVKNNSGKLLDLSYDWRGERTERLDSLPPEVRELTQLESLTLGFNHLSSLPDWIVELTQLKTIDLSSNLLDAIPGVLAELPNLSSLAVGFNAITSIPPIIVRLKSLTSLNVAMNGLVKVPEELSELHNLKSIDLSGNRIEDFPTCLLKLKKLRNLDLADNPLKSVPESVSELRTLTALGLSAKFTSVPEWLVELKGLTSLDLSENQLSTIPNWFEQYGGLTHLWLAGNRFTQIPEVVRKFRKLEHLGFPTNRLTFLPDWISELQSLNGLNFFDNKIETIPDSISTLVNLEWLSLKNNLITEIPDSVYELRSLRNLDFGNLTHVTNKNQIKLISPRVLQMENLYELNLENNPVESPPPEVVANGLGAIKNYFKQLAAEGEDHLYEAKLLIVGEGGAGKTSLAKKIHNPQYELQEEDSTEGIEIIRWAFPLDNSQPFKVNIWDFGGQEIYHATHQFFLTKRSLYLLVADARKEDTDFYYWLNVVEQLSDNSPLLIISNEKQERQREINERQLRGDFSNLRNTLATNLATNRGLDHIVTEVKHYIMRLPQIGAPLPKTWVKVREALEKDKRNYISLREYLEVCERNGFGAQKDKFQLSSYLHDLGVCLHFQDDPLLRKTVILKPRWGTDAVYKVLDNDKVIQSLGKFDRADLANIWSEPDYANMQDELLQLMINFKLCYRIPNSTRYIAPQRLTEKQPDYEWDQSANLILRYTYESFMPKGIVTQFIVSMHKLISDQSFVWKSGVILEKDETKAEVIEDYKRRELRIRVNGKRKKELLTIVAYELDNIHATYRRLKYSKLIPCNCEVCKQRQDPHFYSFDALKTFIGDRQEVIQCQKSYQMVDVRSLIDDVLIRTEGVEVVKQKSEIIFQAPIESLIIQQAEIGGTIVQQNGSSERPIKSAWANGSFYLFVFAVVIAGLGMLARTVPAYALAGILIAGVILIPMIGALQLRQDNRLSEKSFLELLKMVLGQLPLVGKVFGGSKQAKS